MDITLVLTIAVVLVPLVLLLGFAGCVGDDPALVAAKAKEEEKAKEKEAKAVEQAAAKYDAKVGKDGNLVGWWRLDEGQPETGDLTAVDSATTAPHNGQYKNLQAVRRGESGAVTVDKNVAVQFLGTNGYIEVPFNALLNPPMSFSAELWLRPEPHAAAAPAHTVMACCEVNAAGDVIRGYRLQVVYSPKLVLRASVGSGGAATTLDADLGDGLERGGWRHVVMSYDGAAKQLSIYINADDGKADAVLPTPALPAPVGFAANVTAPLRIGAGFDPGGGPGGYFQGRLDEVALYRVALTGPTAREHFLASTA